MTDIKPLKTSFVGVPHRTNAIRTVDHRALSTHDETQVVALTSRSCFGGFTHLLGRCGSFVCSKFFQPKYIRIPRGHSKSKHSSLDTRNQLQNLVNGFSTSQDKCQCRIEVINQELQQISRVTKNRNRMILLLRKRKLLQEQLNKIESARLKVEDYQLVLDDAQVNAEILKSFEDLNSIVHAAVARPQINTQNLNETVENISETAELLQEANETLFSFGIGASDDDTYDNLDEALRQEVDDMLSSQSDLDPLPTLATQQRITTVPKTSHQTSTTNGNHCVLEQVQVLVEAEL